MPNWTRKRGRDGRSARCPAGIPRLIYVAETNSDCEVRRQPIFWLRPCADLYIVQWNGRSFLRSGAATAWIPWANLGVKRTTHMAQLNLRSLAEISTLEFGFSSAATGPITSRKPVSLRIRSCRDRGWRRRPSNPPMRNGMDADAESAGFECHRKSRCASEAR